MQHLRVSLVLTLLFSASPAWACSTFCVNGEDGPIFGKNYDWNVEEGYLVVNRAGIVKEALVKDAPARWTSLYGSVTFNQYGREFPSGGMNTEGLVIELMWLDGTEYPGADERPALGVLQWIQYQLDTAGDVSQVLASDTRIRINGQAPIHYLVADAGGNVTTVEFLDGRLVAHTGDALPSPVLTNHDYAGSLQYLKEHEGFGGSRAPRTGRGSLDRFVRAASRVAALDSDNATVDEAFRILHSVSQGRSTVWSIVYDVEARIIHYRTHAAGGRRWVRMESLDFACDAPSLAIDLNTRDKGDMTAKLVPLPRAANRELIDSSYAQTDFIGRLSDSVLDRVSSYPDLMECAPAN